tara:strand:+ start:1413 stop:1595 length:183 start_codon:yes stop_codon:yes gene_type:complete
MRNSFSEDVPIDEESGAELDDLNIEFSGIQKRRARKMLEDYFEQKRLRECLGDDEFEDID